MLKKIKYLFRDLPVKSYIIYLCVALFLTTGVTFSRFITSTTSGDSSRVAQFGNLTLTETDKPAKYIYAPGLPITKNPKISFNANEMSAYVFVTIYADSWVLNEVTKSYSYDSGKLTWSVNTEASSGWTFLSYDVATHKAVFYKLVPPGVALTDVSVISGDSIAVSEDMIRSQMTPINDSLLNIEIKAYAVQSGGFETAASAWTAVKDK